MVKKGDKVRIGGSIATVIGSYGQGKHTAWQLDDGRTVLDLHKHVETGIAQVVEVAPAIVEAPVVVTPPVEAVVEKPQPEVKRFEKKPQEEDRRSSRDWRLDVRDDQVD